jgi:hypothetical protein
MKVSTLLVKSPGFSTGRFDRIDGVGLAGPAAQLTVQAINLDHLEPAAAQVTSKPSAIGLGAGDRDQLARTATAVARSAKGPSG